jgi:3',5'-cyclic AMP phosphodiesterase CpdA
MEGHFMKHLYLPTLLLVLLLAACGGSDNGTAASGVSSSTGSAAASARFAVFSDPHLYDLSTLGTSSELDAYLLSDRKMLKDSSEILDSVVSDLKSTPLDFVLVTGDLTKDGELVNHQLMAKKLAALEAGGKKVFVIPGNHDIYNPHAKSYLTVPASAVTQVSPADFKAVYRDFGFSEAIYTDSNSLSYIAEPVSGVWLFAIDSCQYASDSTEPITAGKVRAATQEWIVAKLQEARQKGKQVIGMMHHGIAEHYTGQATVFPEYVVDGYAALGETLVKNGLNVMFTGHYHANDVASSTFAAGTLYDVETGSTVTAPSPYRIVDYSIAGKQLAISTRTVTATASHPNDFVSYAKAYLIDGMTTLTTAQLQSAYGLDATTAASLAPMIANSFAAHYAGDEKLSDATTIATLSAMLSSSVTAIRTLAQQLYTLWTDTGPADNTVTLTLA